jgi:hypothetical protein
MKPRLPTRAEGVELISILLLVMILGAAWYFHSVPQTNCFIPAAAQLYELDGQVMKPAGLLWADKSVVCPPEGTMWVRTSSSPLRSKLWVRSEDVVYRPASMPEPSQ